MPLLLLALTDFVTTLKSNGIVGVEAHHGNP